MQWSRSHVRYLTYARQTINPVSSPSANQSVFFLAYMVTRQIDNQYNHYAALHPLHDLTYYVPKWETLTTHLFYSKDWFLMRNFLFNLRPNKQKTLKITRYWIIFHFEFSNHMTRLISWRLIWEEVLNFYFIKKLNLTFKIKFDENHRLYFFVPWAIGSLHYLTERSWNEKINLRYLVN